MKKACTFGILLLALFAFTGCEEDEINDPRPQPPQGVFSITSDESVLLVWNYPYERDIDEFWIYRAQSPDDDPPTEYSFLFAVDAVDNPNLDLVWDSVRDESAANGVTYWYAIASVDHAGQVSDLSAENVFDTPRPEGIVTVYDIGAEPTLAGFDFNGQTRVSGGSLVADVWVDSFEEVFYLNAGDATNGPGLTDIQDMGYTADWDAIGYAPTDGWSSLGYAEVILYHTYIVWTNDEHFAKLWVVDVDPGGSVTFQWAWQPQVNNPELKLATSGSTGKASATGGKSQEEK